MNSVFKDLRDSIAVTKQYTYLDHAAKGPLPGEAAQALRDYADDIESHGGTHWPQWFGQLAEVKQGLANLIGAKPGSIALMRNTAEGIGTVAEGFDWREGENVVLPAAEFPSNLFPWRNLESRGVECRTVASDDGVVDLAKIDAACDSKTRIIACSWVGWATGFRVDLAGLCEIAERRGCRLLIDGIQAVGMQPLDVSQTPIDFLAGEGRKWLLGPEGLGYLYVRPDAVESLRPTRVGWASMKQENVFGDDFAFHDNAARFESGMQALPLVAALNASLQTLAPQSVADRAAYLDELCGYAAERLRSIDGNVASIRGDHASAIVTARFDASDPERLRKHCWDANVIFSARGGGIRFSPHAYNTQEDIDHAASVLQEAVRAG